MAEFDVMFGEGISSEGEIIDYGVKLDIVDKSGAWFSYKDTKLGQGRENSKAFLKENKEVREEILNAIKAQIGATNIMSAGGDDENSDNGDE